MSYINTEIEEIKEGMEFPCTLIIDSIEGAYQIGITASVKELKVHGELLHDLTEDRLREAFDPKYSEYKKLKEIEEIEKQIQELNNEMRRLKNEL